jgi:hypothetical protein
MRMITMKLCAKLLVAWLVCAGATPTMGAGPSGEIPKYLGQFAFCNKYARTAVDQAKRASLSACNFTGPRWTENFREHENWCRSLGSEDAPRAEEAAREAQLATCKAPAVSTPIFRPSGPEPNTDRPGNDYKNFDVSDANACEGACKGDSGCRAWTYVNPGVQGPSARCWLKNAVPPSRQNNCCTSGVK